MALRRAETPAGAQSDYVQSLPRRPRKGHDLQTSRHAQPRRQVPTAAHGERELDKIRFASVEIFTRNNMIFRVCVFYVWYSRFSPRRET